MNYEGDIDDRFFPSLAQARSCCPEEFLRHLDPSVGDSDELLFGAKIVGVEVRNRTFDGIGSEGSHVKILVIGAQRDRFFDLILTGAVGFSSDVCNWLSMANLYFLEFSPSEGGLTKLTFWFASHDNKIEVAFSRLQYQVTMIVEGPLL